MRVWRNGVKQRWGYWIFGHLGIMVWRCRKAMVGFGSQLCWCVPFKPCSRARANGVTSLKRIPRGVFSHLRTLRHQDVGHTEVQPCRITESCSVLCFLPLPRLQGLVSLMPLLLLPSGSPCPEGRALWKGGSSLLWRRSQVWSKQKQGWCARKGYLWHIESLGTLLAHLKECHQLEILCFCHMSQLMISFPGCIQSLALPHL